MQKTWIFWISCSKSPHCQATTIIGLLLLSRVVVRTAPFFLTDLHTMMLTIPARRPRLSRPRLKVTPQPCLHLRRLQPQQVRRPRTPHVRRQVRKVRPRPLRILRPRPQQLPAR
jgi:hypothetical protein